MMVHRKIMALGSSFVVSLPRPWLKTHGLVRGDSVSMVVQRDQTLLVTPERETQVEEKQLHLLIDALESDESITRRIIAGYLDGYNHIKMTSNRFFSVEQQNAIRKIIGTLYMMIEESEASSILIHTLIDEGKASVTSSIERMHIITHSMCRDTLNALSNWDADLARAVISLEDDVDQLMYFLLRLIRLAVIKPSLANQLGLDPLDCLDYQTLVHRVEQVADHVTVIAGSVVELFERGLRVSDDVLSIVENAMAMVTDSYDKAVHSFLSRDISHTNEMIDEQRKIDELFKRITPLPYTGDEGEVSTLTLTISIRESIRRISQLTADIAELTIDRAYKVTPADG